MKTFTEQEIIDHLTGSGADEYSWYEDLYYDESLSRICVAMADGEGGTHWASFTPEELEKIIFTIIAGDDAPAKQIARAVRHDDFDSDDADIVLQIATLGTVVFG